MADDFESLMDEALQQDFSGWDFSYLQGRWEEREPPWDYRQLVLGHINKAISLLDMGTGGGEFLASLPNLPANTCATETYPPNIPIARERLNPLGIDVFTFDSDEELPFSDNSFDLIINRHESYSASEIYRILRPGGRFLTQQVGGRDNLELNEWLQEDFEIEDDVWSLAVEVKKLSEAGLKIEVEKEVYPLTTFKDVGAVVYYLKAIPWQIPDFEVDAYRGRLLALHAHIQQSGGFDSQSHRFYLEAVKRNSESGEKG